ncbi:MAG TPA: hypothetical protein VK911_06400 [Vicinamibacterales bacterium]|nr:hypothetical protein [Vicinamibacterales bacterium]
MDAQNRLRGIDQRGYARRGVDVAGRLVWKDGRGTTRFNSVVIRDISESGAYVESVSGSPIPLYRLVALQAERTPATETLPPFLRQGKVLSAVYRVGPFRQATGMPAGYGLRLLIEPASRTVRREITLPAARALAPAGVTVLAEATA